MGITPLDIRKKAFSVQRRGLAKAEVDEFMAAIADELEGLRKERAQLAERVDELARRLEGYVGTEQLLKDTLLTAQKATDQLREEARKEAELVVARARLGADRIRHQAEQRMQGARQELHALEARRATLTDEIAGIARTYLAMAERMGSRSNHAETADSRERSGDTSQEQVPA